MYSKKTTGKTTQEGKATKGAVTIESFQGRLRLRFRVAGKRYTISLGLPETKEAWKVAEAKAKEIEADITFQRFNPENLDKYRVNGHLRLVNLTEKRQLTLTELWDKYLEYKSHELKESTIDYLRNGLGKLINNCPVQNFNQPLEIRDWLLDKTTSSMVKRIITHLSAAVKWGIKYQALSLSSNPFEGMAAELPKHNWEDNSVPNALNEQEKLLVIQAFENHKGNWNGRGFTGFAYSHYTPFIKFLLLTGCRPSEAIGLQWKNIKNDCSQITFESSIVRIQGKATRMKGSKNNKVRKFNCNQQLHTLLESIKPENPEPESLVFPSPKGKIINYGNFSKVAWKKIVEPILKRKTTPYSCRDTFISEQIAKGVPTAVVAKWCDNSVEVIETKYLDTKLLEQLKPL